MSEKGNSKKTMTIQYITAVANFFEPFKRQPHEMVKHTQTIRRQIADELFECV